MNADGSNQTHLTFDVSGSPVWSPDGKQIAFSTSRNLYLMKTYHSGYDDEPVWSPDGKYIAFVSYRDGNDEIYIMKADGSEVTRLTNNSVDDDYPAWQP
jgi:TolB protein